MQDGLSTIEIILQSLEDAGGAILQWQIPEIEQDTWWFAENAGDIRYEVDTDCFVHPLAIRSSQFGYSMPHQDER